MASRGKKKTTMAKLTRESRLRERRFEKQARKDARKLAALEPDTPTNDEFSEFDEVPATEHPSEQPAESI
ncbi:MAG: hypothetical protein QOD66_1694 [Solirubrobacteraceae bacterium]|jgi:hypothetical protein|nr:hypothetical protein [Solirubrobacteraceae bacterium]MEA2618879.1 hypothetical protein [Chloroflexota bacterium]